jgi:hypothetical protein
MRASHFFHLSGISFQAQSWVLKGGCEKGCDTATPDETEGVEVVVKEPSLRTRMKLWPYAAGGAYEPKPVRRVEIPKPDGAGVRKLGIPSVLDRFIQQAVMQVLQRQWDRTFSDHSYGFRPGRSRMDWSAPVLKGLRKGVHFRHCSATSS